MGHSAAQIFPPPSVRVINTLASRICLAFFPGDGNGRMRHPRREERAGFVLGVAFRSTVEHDAPKMCKIRGTCRGSVFRGALEGGGHWRRTSSPGTVHLAFLLRRSDSAAFRYRTPDNYPKKMIPNVLLSHRKPFPFLLKPI